MQRKDNPATPERGNKQTKPPLIHIFEKVYC